MTPIYLLRDNEPTGPFSEQEIHEHLAQGRVTAAEYAWREGMAEWQPLAKVVALPSAPPPAPPEPPPGLASATPPPPAQLAPAPSARSKKRVPPAHVMTGLSEFLEVFPDRLTITPKGGLGLKAKGSPGIRQIFVAGLLGVTYKLPGFTSGYLEFSLTGGEEESEALFRFAKTGENIETAGRITAYIESRLREARAASVALSSVSLSNELAKLAELHGQGALTAEEFQAAKGRLLS